MYISHRKTGFTLIEFLVTVLIIGILAAVAIPAYEKAVEKTRAMQAVMMVKAIADAQASYQLSASLYATNLDDLEVEIPGDKFVYDGHVRKKKGKFDFGIASETYPTVIALSSRWRGEIGNSVIDYSILRFANDYRLYCKVESGGDPAGVCEELSNGEKGTSTLTQDYYVIK